MPRFKAEARSWFRHSWDYLRSMVVYLHKGRFAGVETRLQFVAPPRSGHTLIGSLLDAHPEMVIAHEMDSLGYYSQGYRPAQVDHLLVDSSKAFTKVGRQWMGYDYRVPGQWQGNYQRLRVIGDKSGGRTARRIYHADDPALLLEPLQKPAGRQLVFLHLIRHPFDNIITMMKRTNTRRAEAEITKNLRKKIRHYFLHLRGVERLKAMEKFRIIEVYHEDFVGDPKSELRRICHELGLQVSEDYLDACAALVWDKPKKTRSNTQLWTPELTALVTDEMRNFPWLDRYQS